MSRNPQSQTRFRSRICNGFELKSERDERIGVRTLFSGKRMKFWRLYLLYREGVSESIYMDTPQKEPLGTKSIGAVEPQFTRIETG